MPVYVFSVQALRLNFTGAEKDALSDFRRDGETGDQLRSCIRSEYDSLEGDPDLSFEEWAVVRVRQTSKNDLIERNVAALLRKMMAAAHSRHDNGEAGCLI